MGFTSCQPKNQNFSKKFGPYLTPADDGPHPVYTEQILDGLKKRNVKSTFFILGEQAELYPDIVKRMGKEGHLIGNHTYSHLQYSSSRELEFGQELVKTNEILKDITVQD